MPPTNHNNGLESRVATLEAVVHDMRDSLRGIDSSLKTLTRLEERHTETREQLARAFKVQAELERDIQELRQEMPVIRLVNKYLISAVVGIVGIIGVAVLKVVLKGGI